MSRNFDQRAAIYAISERNLKMVDIARQHGAHAKFAGSGGAVIGVYTDEAQYKKLSETYRAEGYEIFKPEIKPSKG